MDPSGFETKDTTYSNGDRDIVFDPDLVVVTAPIGPPPTVAASRSGLTAAPNDMKATGNATVSTPEAPADGGGLLAAALVPIITPGAPGSPLGAPGTPWSGPLSAPGPFRPDAFAPGSFIEPPPPGAGLLEAPGLPAVPAEAPGVTFGGVLGGAAFILSMGMTFSGDANLDVPREYDVVLYKDKAPGFENHHGVLDKWASKNVPGYVSRAADSTTIRLSVPHHRATLSIYRDWLKERTGQGVGGFVDWTTVTPREILELSERQLNIANVPSSARLEYYGQLTSYIYGLK